MEDKAARVYDCAAFKYWGPSTHINFSVENYEQELEGMKNVSMQEYVALLRKAVVSPGELQFTEERQDIISKEGGKHGLGASQETRIYILECLEVTL